MKLALRLKKLKTCYQEDAGLIHMRVVCLNIIDHPGTVYHAGVSPMLVIALDESW